MIIAGAVLQYRGDWAWMKQAFGLTGWKGEGKNGRVCWKCMADKCDHPFTDMALGAAWRRTMITHAGFLGYSLLTGSMLSNIFSIPGFQVDYMSFDYMHACDLGIAQYMLGNVLWEVFLQFGGQIQNPKKAVAEILVMIKHCSKIIDQKESPINSLTLPMIKATGKAPKCKTKAAETRHMVPVVLRLLSYLPRDTRHDKLRYDCLFFMNAVYEEMYNWGPGSGDRIAEYGRRHCVLYTELNREAHANMDFLFWQTMPKHHMYLHCVEHQIKTAGNPKHHWCYGDEAEIGAAALKAESGHVLGLNRFLVLSYRLGSL